MAGGRNVVSKFAIKREIKQLRQEIGAPVVGRDMVARYASDPFLYAREVLQVDWWNKQREIVHLLQQPPYRVLVKASHSVGKSHLAGGLVNWWYDTHKPGICLTTAPTDRQVKKILWKEVRVQRRGRRGFIGPRAAELSDAPNHFAQGFTANTGTGFQGQHGCAILIIFDEAVGIDAEFWEAARTMTMGQRHGWVCFCNPTDTSSRFYAEEQLGGWHVVHIACTDHPNIAAELNGKAPPYPDAVRLEWLEERLAEWARPVVGEPRPTDLEWPPGSGMYLRPGPLAEARLLGRWPSQTYGVWSDSLWASCEVEAGFRFNDVLQIGCDVARAGDDNTSFVVRIGINAMHCEEVNGFKTNETAGRLKELCKEWSDWWNDNVRERGTPKMAPEEVLCTIDDAGVGGGVVDQSDGYNFVGVNAGSTAMEWEKYPNIRSELWFNTTSRAERGELATGRLSKETRLALRVQAMAPPYKLDAAGRRVVEPKVDTKERLGQSPDGMDGFNLAYYEPGGQEVPYAVPVDKPRRERKPGRKRHWK